ncbi:hypothetical protein ACFQS1_30740 [Paractinoplanes rhizophilus]|jgi:hypothetical protein|uniref:Uncharacterized protein n=1 Tax=Paractinoplanes rhizophilus TaxID=1416877 RepID=A0ABW2I0Q4_9ACTN|nr:hypothetical protein [Actinoplanes sp.]
MATYEDWMDAYDAAYDALPRDADLACPNCGHHTLRLIFTGDLDRDVGYGSFWCDTCLLGVGTCRTIIPDGAVVRDIHLSSEERVPQIPNFRLVPMND